jgi:hypothetical protein
VVRVSSSAGGEQESVAAAQATRMKNGLAHAAETSISNLADASGLLSEPPVGVWPHGMAWPLHDRPSAAARGSSTLSLSLLSGPPTHPDHGVAADLSSAVERAH